MTLWLSPCRKTKSLSFNLAFNCCTASLKLLLQLICCFIMKTQEVCQLFMNSFSSHFYCKSVKNNVCLCLCLCVCVCVGGGGSFNQFYTLKINQFNNSCYVIMLTHQQFITYELFSYTLCISYNFYRALKAMKR